MGLACQPSLASQFERIKKRVEGQRDRQQLDRRQMAQDQYYVQKNRQAGRKATQPRDRISTRVIFCPSRKWRISIQKTFLLTRSLIRFFLLSAVLFLLCFRCRIFWPGKKENEIMLNTMRCWQRWQPISRRKSPKAAYKRKSCCCSITLHFCAAVVLVNERLWYRIVVKRRKKSHLFRLILDPFSPFPLFCHSRSGDTN